LPLQAGRQGRRLEYMPWVFAKQKPKVKKRQGCRLPLQAGRQGRRLEYSARDC
jgi:hypothetical protein